MQVEEPNAEETPIPKDAHTFEMRKTSSKNLNEDKIRENLDYIKGRIDSAARSGKWTISHKVSSLYNSLRKEHTYKAVFALLPIIPKNRNPDLEFAVATEIARQAGSSSKWELVKTGDTVLVSEEMMDADIDIPSDWKEAHFSHIYGRDAQIDIVMSAIEAGIQSNFENRFHCVLQGPPACGKSEITKAFKTMFGNDAVIEYDGTNTSQAGALRDLKDRLKLPRLLIVEEIEKTDENSLRWLLSLLDHRAEIRKTNYRESFQKEVKLMCIATVNDYALFKKMMYGALSSRFTHHIYCQRPTPEILRMILLREIKKLGENGNVNWVEPAIKYAKETGITDPRQVTAICLCGRDELITGEYQKKLASCASPSNDV